MINLFVFLMGLILGSFLNVCIYRFPKNKSIVFPASHCPLCQKPILWYDNIPLVSYVILGGRCRFCRGRIGFRYFMVELLSGILTVALFLTFGLNEKFAGYMFLTSGLIVATFVDFELQEIPDQVTISGIIAGAIFAALFPSILGASSWVGGLVSSIVGMIAGGGSIYLMGFFGELVFKKEAMGGGDVKLLAMVGAFLGWKLALVTFFVAPIFGAVVGIALKIKDGREIIPYGPYLSLATLVSIFWGEKILGFFIRGLY